MYEAVKVAAISKLLRSAICPIVLLGFSPARAEKVAPADRITGNVALTSDYRFRGLSYSGQQPALQGGLTFAGDPGWFAGIWGSVSRAGSRAGDEIDLYAGQAGELRGVAYSLTAYVYMDGEASHVQYAEFQTLLTQRIGPVSVQLEASSAPKQRRGTASNLYLAVSASIPIVDPRLTINLHAGRENGFFNDKIDWEGRLSYRLTALTLSASVVGSTHAYRLQPGTGYEGGTRLVLTAAAAF